MIMSISAWYGGPDCTVQWPGRQSAVVREDSGRPPLTQFTICGASLQSVDQERPASGCQSAVEQPVRIRTSANILANYWSSTKQTPAGLRHRAIGNLL